MPLTTPPFHPPQATQLENPTTPRENLTAFPSELTNLREKLSNSDQKLTTFSPKLTKSQEKLTAFLENPTTLPEKSSTLSKKSSTFGEKSSTFSEKLSDFGEKLTAFCKNPTTFLENWSTFPTASPRSIQLNSLAANGLSERGLRLRSRTNREGGVGTSPAGRPVWQQAQKARLTPPRPTASLRQFLPRPSSLHSCSSRREEAHSISGERSQSLLTSAATV